MPARMIDSVQMDLLHGRPEELRETVEVERRRGLDGYELRTEGKADGEFELRSVLFCADNTAANLHITTMKQKQGTIVSVDDTFGDNHTNVLLVKVALVSKAKRIKGGSAVIRVELSYQCLKAAVS